MQKPTMALIGAALFLAVIPPAAQAQGAQKEEVTPAADSSAGYLTVHFITTYQLF